ncbi:MAG: hypothetical protein ACOCRN_01845 [Spirochaetia bacterium]
MTIRYALRAIPFIVSVGIVAFGPVFGVSANDFDMFPAEAQTVLEEAESARADWEARREQIDRDLEQQPWETQEDYENRRQEAYEQERSYRYLLYRLDELEWYEFRSDHDDSTVEVGDYRQSDREWPIRVDADLEFLPSRRQFELTYSVADSDDPEAAYRRFEDALERDDLAAEVVYGLQGQIDDAYVAGLSAIEIVDTRNGETLHRDSVSGRYEFAAGEAPSEMEPEYRYQFGDGTLPDDFSQGGEAQWTVTDDTSYSNTYSIRSGDVSHNEQSSITLSGEVPSGSRLTGVTFALRVSSESGFDHLRFYDDDNAEDDWSGDVSWQLVTIPVSYEPGESFEFRWSYEKDGSVDNGEDAAWIDDVELEFE